MGTEQKIKKDLIAIPLTIQNTGALSTSFQVALLVRFTGKDYSMEFDYNGHAEPYAVMTNDFEVESLRYSEWLKGRNRDSNLRFQDIIGLNYSSGFALKGRDTVLKLCAFYPVNNELMFPISDYGGRAIEISLLYRKNPPRKKRVDGLRSSGKCNCHISAKLDSRGWKWRRAFDIRWEIAKDMGKRKSGDTLSVTRFEFHPNFPWRKFWPKIPTLLMCEDV